MKMADSTHVSTTDLVDEHEDSIQSCDVPLRDLGGLIRFSGRIATFRSPVDNLQLKAIVEEPGDARVLVVDAGGSLHAAMAGGNMVARAAANGWAGLVVNGVVRDTEELAALPIGVKAIGTNPRRSTKNGLGERDVEVEFGSVVFRPGEFLAADEDGVVVLTTPTG